MRNIFILVVLGFFVVVIHSRPSQSDESNESQEEMEYENENGSPAEETMEESHFGDEDPNRQEVEQTRRLLDLNRNNNYLLKNLAEDPGARPNVDAPDYKPARNREARDDKSNEAMENNNDEFQTYGKRHQFSRYIENNDGNDRLEMAQHLTNRDVNNYKNSRTHNNLILDSPIKRTVDSKKTHNDEGVLLFGNNREPTCNVDKNDYNVNEPMDLNQRAVNSKQYYNPMQPENRGMLDVNSRNNEYSYYNRDRRDTKTFNQGDPGAGSNIENSNESLEKSDNESEEMAIRKHIKKMSGDELEQLLNSLSEEKRALLKKIIDDVDIPEKTYDSINKREITKKAGAVEDNSYIESGQSESSKIQGAFSAIDVTTALPSPQNNEPTDTIKPTENQPDTSILTNQKSSEYENTESKADLKNNNDNSPEKSKDSLNSCAPKTDAIKNQAEVAVNEQVKPKNENKRETNLEGTADTISFKNSKMSEGEYTKESRSDDGYFFPKDDNLSQFLDDVEQSRSFDSSKIYRRDVDEQSELDAKLKSLEESFPNDAYDESGPLIRVKRKNIEQVMKKRSAAVCPDAKVGFLPYKAGSNDEDTDEGNEFDDDGFYDPTPNFVSNENKNIDSQQAGRDDANCKLTNVDQLKSPITDASGATINLGSDTDTVLSSVEGVDENLMFSSGTRNRRKTDGNYVENVDGNNIIQSSRGKTSDGETKTTSNNDINIPNYQDSDSFGGFPRNYEGDLGRYKRIRRVKQSHMSEEPSNT